MPLSIAHVAVYGGGASGRLPVSHATLHNPPCLDLTDPINVSDTVVPPVALQAASGDSGLRSPNAPRENALSDVLSHPISSTTLAEENCTPTLPFLSFHTFKGSLGQRSQSPPPVLLSSITNIQSHRAPVPLPDHSRIVAQVTAALDEGSMEEDSDQEEDVSEGTDDQMSEEEEPDDLMTLDQFQEEARREALIRKGSLLAVQTQKKGRLEKGETSHS